jgi:N6-L-threonylcarbamoyladenine synthase/protein kinase Bud32
MHCLGIESTAHTFGVGILDSKGKVYADARDMYIPKKGWGIIPTEAAQHHEHVRKKVLEEAFSKANLTMKDVDVIAYSEGPGLAPCLHKGFALAQELSEQHKKPLIGVNHLIGHIEIAKLQTRLKDPITLLTTGANNQVVAFVSGRYRLFGETMDVGVGNALDKFGREVGLDFPAGPKIEALAKKGKYTELPYVVKGMDLSFSGILTAALNKVKQGEKLEDVCFSLQETFFAMMVEVTERAMAHTGKNELILTGGVAQNARLRKMLEIMCKERQARFAVCPKAYCGDNGVMIAWLGLLMHKTGKKVKKPALYPRQRIDEVDVSWL